MCKNNFHLNVRPLNSTLPYFNIQSEILFYFILCLTLNKTKYL